MTNTLLPSLTLAAGILASVVEAHGYIQGVVADGVFYQGYRPSFQYLSSQPVIPSWSDPLNLDNGYVNDYTSPDIICQVGATPGKTFATVKAGGTVELQWTPWPSGHLGPVITYLANCNGNCSSVDKTKLLFNKIDQAGLLTKGFPGYWATQELIANNNSWTVQIPKDIAPGQYVLRHELIALQEAMALGGAQNYPQCVNLLITGSGSDSLQTGTLGTSLYNKNEPGLHIDIYQNLNNYTIPGPALISDAGNYTQSSLNSTTSTTSVASVSSAIVSSTKSATSSSSTSSGATISISSNSSSSTSTRTSLGASGQGFYSVSVSATGTTSTTAVSATVTVSVNSQSLVSQTDSSASSISTATSISFSNITTFQTVTRSDSSTSASIFMGSVTDTTTTIAITVTVPGSFVDPPSPTNATLTTTSSASYPSTNSTFSAPYPFSNGTSTLSYGTGTAHSTGWRSKHSGTAYSTRSLTTSCSTGTGAPFLTWMQATTTTASVDNGYKPRRNVRSVKPRQPWI